MTHQVNPTGWGHDGIAVTDLLAGVLEDAQTALAETLLGAPPKAFIAHMVPVDDDGHFVALWVMSWLRARHGTFPRDQLVVASAYDGHMGTVLVCELVLRRPFAPILEPNPADPFPDTTRISAFAQSMIVDARCLDLTWRQAVEARCKTLDVDVAWGPMQPSGDGDIDGWHRRFYLSLEGRIDC